MTPTRPSHPAGDLRGNRLRLRTLIRVRWIAVAGQIAALLVARFLLDVDVYLGGCLILVALSALLNVTLTLVFPAGTQLSARQVMLMLWFDIAQILALVALTGGLLNPFAFLVLAPVTIAATVLPLRPTLAVVAVAVVLITAVDRFHIPLRLMDGTILMQSPLMAGGFWVAIITGIGFVTLYARWVSLEIHTMSEALLATQMALSRAQKLTDLGGVVAATAHELGTPLATIKLTSSEMIPDLADRPLLADDARLIRDQVDRCRDILRSMGQAGKRDSYISRAPLTEVVREAAEPHMDRGKAVLFKLSPGLAASQQPLIERRPELIHGLRNLIQNAVDFANATVNVEIGWTGDRVRLRISDDGPGYPAHKIARLGEPFLPGRDKPDLARPGYEGMGLGLFIAKTLLEQTGAEIVFMNGRDLGAGSPSGALVTVDWPAKAGIATPAGQRPPSADNPPITG